jgi:hypothetical protein
MAVRRPKMTPATQPESESHRLVRKLLALKMNVGPVSTGFDGKESLEVNGNRLTVEQLLEIDRAGELTSWGIADYIEKHKVKR